MNDKGAALVALGGIAAVVSYLMPQGGRQRLDGGWLTWEPDTAESNGYAWEPPTQSGRDRAAPYLDYLSQISRENRLPAGLLARVAWQESRFRDDIVGGHTRSSVGAIGMFQFMPSTAANPGYGVDRLHEPRNWKASARSAGQYLRAMRDATGSWAEALAAYNWGLGNVRRKGLNRAPRETRDYYRSITQDLNLT